MPKTRENIRRARCGDRERRRVRIVEHGGMSLPRRAGPRRGVAKTRARTKQRLASRSRFGLPAPRGGAVSDADALAIAQQEP